MRIRVLGSAAGGGFPQWNCACTNCSALRDGRIKARPRTQFQIALATFPPDTPPRHRFWSLIGASPDLRSQVAATPELAPIAGSNGSPISAVYLPSADVDAVMGLLHLREFQTFLLVATEAVRSVLWQDNAIFRVLTRANPPVAWTSLEFAGDPRTPAHHSPNDPYDTFCYAVPLGGEFPDYVSDRLRGELPAEEAVVAFVFEQAGKRLFVAPSLSGRNSVWKRWVESSDLILIDGTFWSDDELIQTGRSKKTAREIGHLPLSGPGGLLGQYPKDAKGRKVLIHINNTNPILDEDSAEHHAVLDAGFEIAYDGMEFEL